MRQWIYKGPLVGGESKIIDDSELDSYLKSGWSESPGNNQVEPEGDIDDLRQKAIELDIKVDGRWGESRLQKEIAKHENVDISP